MSRSFILFSPKKGAHPLGVQALFWREEYVLQHRQSHDFFYHRYHIVWITKYRYKVLQGKLRERVRDIIRQVCREMGVQIIEGVLSSDHIHMFVSVPPHVAISDLMQRAKGRSSYKIQMEFPEIRKRYWGKEILGPGIFLHNQWKRH